MTMTRSTSQADNSNHDNTTASFPLLNLSNAVKDPNIRIDISLNGFGMFAQTSVDNENATAFLRLLPSAVDAEPESYQQKDDTSLAAIAILKRHPELLFRKGIVTDHFGRKIFASPYQLFLGAGDVWALRQVHEDIIPKIDNGEALAQAQFKAQFPHCQQGFDPKKGEEQLFDDRNSAQVAQVIQQLKIITACITADPCTNGLATRPETIHAVEALCQIFKPKEDEVIRTGLHFPLAILHAIYKVYDAQFNSWSLEQLAFYSRIGIGSAEAALTAVDGQCCKYGLGKRKLDMKKGPDRRDGLFCRHPKGIPQELAPITNKLSEKMFVDPFDGNSCFLSSRVGVYDWYNKSRAFGLGNGRGWAERGGATLSRIGKLMENKSRDLWAILCSHTSMRQHIINTPVTMTNR